MDLCFQNLFNFSSSLVSPLVAGSLVVRTGVSLERVEGMKCQIRSIWLGDVQVRKK